MAIPTQDVTVACGYEQTLEVNSGRLPSTRTG
jgi:hypothetical protein